MSYHSQHQFKQWCQNIDLPKYARNFANGTSSTGEEICTQYTQGETRYTSTLSLSLPGYIFWFAFCRYKICTMTKTLNWHQWLSFENFKSNISDAIFLFYTFQYKYTHVAEDILYTLKIIPRNIHTCSSPNQRKWPIDIERFYLLMITSVTAQYCNLLIISDFQAA